MAPMPSWPGSPQPGYCLPSLNLRWFSGSLRHHHGVGNRNMSEAGVKKYIVRLSADERSTLEALISKGKAAPKNYRFSLVLSARSYSSIPGETHRR
jgi:hypothetical protein